MNSSLFQSQPGQRARRDRAGAKRGEQIAYLAEQDDIQAVGGGGLGVHAEKVVQVGLYGAVHELLFGGKIPPGERAQCFLECGDAAPAQTGKGIGEKAGIGLTIIAASQLLALKNPVPPASVPAQGVPPAMTAFLRYVPGGFEVSGSSNTFPAWTRWKRNGAARNTPFLRPSMRSF